jgi:O-antigen/teichoic acid export membrane protein
MAFLSLTLKDSINRWANIIGGIVFVVLATIGLSNFLAKLSPWAIVIWISQVVANALIVWYAWKSKQKA